MGEIVNLKQRRKQKARAANEEKAAANRARFGRSGKDKSLTEAERQKAVKDLEAHKREE
jgi:hypothetical protein